MTREYGTCIAIRRWAINTQTPHTHTVPHAPSLPEASLLAADKADAPPPPPPTPADTSEPSDDPDRTEDGAESYMPPWPLLPCPWVALGARRWWRPGIRACGCLEEPPVVERWEERELEPRTCFVG